MPSCLMTTDNLADIYPASPLTQWYDKEAPVCADLLHATSIIGKKNKQAVYSRVPHMEKAPAAHM